ncbi:MAG: ROK family transcriptional regulator [Bryobacterales bacterium]|nr:ROK family transcriptional regulator [Bryobacterales bacterium]
MAHKPVSAVTFTTQGALRKSALRQANERLVLNAIREDPQLSRVEISRITGLSPSSVTFIVQRLTKAKLIREYRNDSVPQVGRPPTSLRLAPGARLAVGVEIANSKSRVALADWTGQILEVHDVPWQSDPDEMLRTVHSVIRGLLASKPSARFLGVGVSVPGTWDKSTGTLVSAVNLGWQDVAVESLLAKGFDVPVYFDNNANLSAVGERWFRSRGGKILENFVFVTLSGGIGTGILIGGHVLHGAFGRAGEFGHMTMHSAGSRCPCGNRGCWEEYASDRALSRSYRTAASVDRDVPATEIAELAIRGEEAAVKAIREVSQQLALGLANLIIGLNPEAIVVDTWAAVAWELVEKEVWATLRERVPAAWLDGVRIRPSTHAENASLLGAVALVLARFFQSFEQPSRDPQANRVQIRG